jgi:spore coat polysaccharide biosynthesis protein SpsF
MVQPLYKKAKYGIIIQARMGSKRLPGKILKKINTKSILDFILFFFKNNSSSLIKEYVVATSVLKRDEKIIDWCKINKINYFRASEKNVLSRYFYCAKKYNIQNIIRLTADNPFVDFAELNKMIKIFEKKNYDYISNQSFLPKGMGCEIIAFEALKKSFNKAKKLNQKEHINEYILENKKEFKIKILKNNKKKIYSKLNFSIDTIHDYNYCSSIINNISQPITIKKIIKYAIIQRKKF